LSNAFLALKAPLVSTQNHPSQVAKSFPACNIIIISSEQNYFKGFEIYFQGTKIYFQGFEINFQATKKVYIRGAKKKHPRDEGKASMRKDNYIKKTSSFL